MVTAVLVGFKRHGRNPEIRKDSVSYPTQIRAAINRSMQQGHAATAHSDGSGLPGTPNRRKFGPEPVAIYWGIPVYDGATYQGLKSIRDACSSARLVGMIGID